ncbi:hypothetical protein [Amycolatopsis anabasis]|uniref:hypothetical protein n=1 Tax=Amycolatopsis anabasis TaxID=1840409 RepID=UPI00131D5A09|nr:hypothetical protein [Amycolatopsis anabasis]
MAEQTEGAESPMSARESLDLIDRENRAVSRNLGGGGVALGVMWALLWFAIFVSFHLAGKGWPGPWFPLWVPMVVLAVAVVGGVAVSIVVGARSGRGLRGPSRVSGALYGWSWTLSYFAMVAVNLIVQRQLPEDVIPMLWAGTMMVLAGALSLAGGAMFRDIPMYFLGVWLLLAGVGAVLVGPDYQSLVMGFGGLVGFGGRAVFCLRAHRKVAV